MKYYIAIVNNSVILDGGGHETEEEAREYIESITCLPYSLQEFDCKEDYNHIVLFTWDRWFTKFS